MEDVNLNLDKEISGLGGFEEVFDHIATKRKENPADLENQDDNDDSNQDNDDQNDNNQNNDNQNDDDNNDDQNDNDQNDDNQDDNDDQNDDDNQNDTNDLGGNDDTDDDTDDEAEMITPFVDLFAEKLGWEMEDENKPKSVEGLVEFMDNIIENNSAPNYHSDEVRKLDEYARNGGDVRKYLIETNAGVDPDNLDITKESNQKLAVKEHMKISNPKYTDERIDKKIERFEESGILEEEAEESLEFLQTYKTEKREKLLVDQQKQADDRVKDQQKFITSVQDTINKASTILGIPLNTAQKKKELIDYILKVDAQGRTKNQIDYSKDPIQRLIETAFMQKEGKNFENKLNNKAQNNAISDFKNKLKNNKNNKGKHQKGYVSKGGSFDLISSVSKQLM